MNTASLPRHSPSNLGVSVFLKVVVPWLRSNRVGIVTATNYTPIEYGQRYTVDQTWVDSTPAKDPHAPANGFVFHNPGVAASAVVATKFNDKFVPIYISRRLLPPAHAKGGEALVPKASVAVWFQMDVNSGVMTDMEEADLYVIDVSTSNV